MRAEILVGRERRRRWSIDDKLQIVREADNGKVSHRSPTRASTSTFDLDQ
jgi:transposase-like protein